MDSFLLGVAVTDNKKKYTINEMYDEIEEQDIINYCKRLIETFKAPNFSNLKNLELEGKYGYLERYFEIMFFDLLRCLCFLKEYEDGKTVIRFKENFISFLEFGYDNSLHDEATNWTLF